MKFLEDQVDSGASMGTERILFVIEDLYRFQGKSKEITDKLKEKIGFDEKVENLIEKMFERKSKIT